VDDPYFGGDGPRRVGCTRIGRCMLGCPNGSKNSTDKNYLFFAHRLGVRIEAGREVVGVRPLGDSDGRDGWEIVHRRTGGGARTSRVVRAGGVVLAGGALGTNELLARARFDGALPRLSSRLGQLVRTNSEAVLVVTVPEAVQRRSASALRSPPRSTRTRTPTSRRSLTARAAARSATCSRCSPAGGTVSPGR
jgi:cholesterol oxidase